MKLFVGAEIRFFEWDTDHYNIHRALVRDWNLANLRVDLSWYDTSAHNLANVYSKEERGDDPTGDDYWSHAFLSRNSLYHSRPFTNPTPSGGDVVWYFRYDGTAEEHINHLAVVRNVGGGDPPQIGIFYINSSGTRTPASNVEAFSEISFPTTDDYWARRVLLV